jgi:transposase
MYRERNRIERMIGHLKIDRAIATRYDKLAQVNTLMEQASPPSAKFALTTT